MRVDRKRGAVTSQAEGERPGMDGEAQRNSDQSIARTARGCSGSSFAGTVQSFVEVRNCGSRDECERNSSGKISCFPRDRMRASFGVQFHIVRATDLDSFEAGSD